MLRLSYLLLAARALGANKFRSSLTVLSVTLGTFAIVLMSSLAVSALDTVRYGIEELGGARLMMIVPKEPERAELKGASYRRGGFTRAERDWLLEGIPHVADRTMYVPLGTKDVTGDAGTVTRTDVIAADSHFLDVYRIRLLRGRAFGEEENQQHAKVCVVGHKLAAKLWDGSPLGRKLTIGALRCRVIGELRDNPRVGVGFGFDWVDLVVAPYETVAETDTVARQEAMMMLNTDDPRSNDIVKRMLNARLVHRHHGIDDFTFYDFSGVLEKFAAMFAIMEVIVGLVASIALLIGGIGVMNMMLVSVSERVREIGVRRALGATRVDIRAQFIAEALLLSGLGGVLGASGGAALAAGASTVIHRFILPTWIGSVSMTAALVAVGVSLGVGVVFGYFPARNASMLDPIEAIRR